MEKILKSLAELGERQLSQETAALELIQLFLDENDVSYEAQSFDVSIPQETLAKLTLDGKEFPCTASSFVSGEVNDKETIISSAMPMAESPDRPNINFNPYCSEISRANCYRNPAIAVTHNTLNEVLKAKKVHAEVEVDIENHTSANILVGNTEHPEAIFFTHYDSIGPGANDNASGVACLCECIVKNPNALANNLFVIAGAEELSTDEPFYWGAGYRRFHEQYSEIVQSVQNIIVIDSVGAGPIEVFKDPRIIRRAFPIHDMDVLVHKISLIAGDLEALMPVYHSALDTAEKIDTEALKDALGKLEGFL